MTARAATPTHLIAFAALGMVGIVAADFFGSDTLVVQVVAFLGTVFAVMRAGRKVEEKVEAVQSSANSIEHAVNGPMEARFRKTDERLSRIEARLDELAARLPPIDG